MKGKGRYLIFRPQDETLGTGIKTAFNGFACGAKPMGELLDKHLYALAGCMGRYLRGFDDPRIHLGTEERFVDEFKKLLDFPSLRAPAGDRVVSYAEATRSFHLRDFKPETSEMANPVVTMMLGLGGQHKPAGDQSSGFAVDRLFKDISGLLRTPLLRFYVQIADPAEFQASLDEIAEQKNFPLAFGSQGTDSACPNCRRLLVRDSRSSPFRCTHCGQIYETLLWLPMVSGLTATVSYELLRHMVELENVRTYQEEGMICLT